MYRITAVSYLNTYPLIYGLKNHQLNANEFELRTAVPSEVANQLISGQTDIGLVPVAAIPQIPNANIISSYCIGADGPVKSVILLSKKPLQEIGKIHLDADSRTSVMLARILAKWHWKIHPEWENGGPDMDPEKVDAAVIIGDKVFKKFPNHHYRYDLAEHWKIFTALPFTFAVWVANKNIDPEFIGIFNDAQKKGLENISDCVHPLPEGISETQAVDYLTNNISYEYSAQKKLAVKKFLAYTTAI